jgi:hypothetical protein
MKKISKKILSILMAAAMVATMLPTFALTALADSAPSGTKSEYAYFVRNLDGVTQNNVTWNEGANFEGNGYAKLNDTPLSAVTATSGFIISMDVFNTDNANAKKFFKFKNGSNYIAVDSGSPDWWTRFRTEISNGTNTRGYYTSDFTSAEFTSKQHTDSGNNSYPVNDWYNLTLVMNTDGSYSYYKDYELLATFKSNYISTNNGGGLTDEAAASAISSATEYIIGAADTSAYEGYTGKIKNLRIFATSEAKALQLAMINYENKMAEGKVYKNMSAAYNAYVAANKGFDAYIYGGDTSVDIAALASNLEIATNNMTEWSAYTGTATVKLANYDADSAYYNKVLYASSTTNFSDEGSCGNLRYKSYVPAVVIMYYDGVTSTGTPKFPAGFEIKRANNSNRSCAYCYVSSSNNTDSSDTSDANFGFTGRWIGYSTTWNNGVPWNTYGTSENFGGTYGSNYNQQVSWTSSRYYINKMEYKGTTSYNNNNSIYYTLYNQERGAYNSIGANCARYVVNYAQIRDAIASKTNYLTSVESYREGGLSTVLSRYDDATSFNITSYFTSCVDSNVATCYGTAQNRASIVAGQLSTVAAPTADSSDYDTLRSYLLNGLNTKSFPDIEGGRAFSAQEIYNSSTLNSDILENYDAFETAYENAVAHMAAIPANGYGHTAVASKTAAQLGSELSSAYDNLMVKSNIETPTISLFNNDVYLGVNDKINIASTESETAGTVTYNIYYDVDNTSGAPDRTGSFSFNSNTDVAVFLDNSHSKAIVTAIGTETQGGAQSNIARTTFYRLQDPSFTGIVDGGAIPASGVVALGSAVQATKAATNDGNTITIQYKYGSGEWQDALNGEIPAFEELSGSKYASVNQISIRTVIKNGDDVIAKSEGTASVTLAREADFDIYVEAPGSNTYYNKNRYDRDKIIIYDTVNYSDDIVYTISADGVVISGTGDDVAGVFTYDKENGIDLKDNSDLANAINEAKYITITAYSKDVKDGNYNTSATKNLFNGGYDALIYHESFNGSVSNGTYTTNDAKGVNIVKQDTATIAVAEKAGDRQGISNQDESGTSGDLRKNALKISGSNSGSGEAYAQLSTNPFADAYTKALAQENGVTISFWRAMENQNTTNNKSVPSGTLARNGIAFRRPNPTDQRGYFMIELTGNISYAETTSRYFDIVPSEYDQTQFTASKYAGYWQHIAVTINPNASTVGEAVTIYINGVPHDLPNTLASSGGTLSASDLINMITDSTTSICLAHDNKWQTHSDDVYLDDIRFYSKALTQKEVWDGYYDQYSDTPTVEGNYVSVTHDPTTVTVYTLKTASYGMPAGSMVGQEFIDLYNVPSSNYNVEYYSYGTGLQIYHSLDGVNWEIVGDSEGRVAYQNRDEFVRGNDDGSFTPMYYRDALDEVCDEVYNMASSGQRAYAGNLIWAPHVCYNLEKNKWMMYVSVSFWGDAKSAIIALESADGTPEHFLARTSSNTQAYNVVLKSNGRPNSIDPCVYYGHNSDGTINRYALYMSYGAWSESGGLNKDLCVIQLQTDGKKTSSNSAAYPVTFANATWASSGSYICSSQPSGNDPNTCTGEGSFIIYHDGYYYLYTAFGVNEYNYTTRIFRSTSPTGPFTDYNGVSATTTSQVHGTQTMAPHYVAIDDYVYASTGHGSLYNAVNNNGETILVYAAHGRPISNNANDYKEIPDAAMVTRQKGQFIGNITVNYPTFYTQSGWTISMPEMYNGTDTSKNIKASQMDGIYASSTLNDVIDTNLKYSSKAKPSGYSTNWDFSHQVYFSHETETTGVVYSTDSINVNYTYELSYDSENPAESTTTYITIKNGNTVMAEGVVAMHNGSPEIAFFNKNQITLGSETVKASTTVWSVKTSDLVHADYTALDSAYAEGDTLLKSLNGKAAQYSADSVQTLITRLGEAKSEATKSVAWKGLEPTSSQASITQKATNIQNAIAGLTPISTATEVEDFSTYEAAVSAINNIDPDAYEETDGHLAGAISTANTMVSSSTKTYENDYTINVVDGTATDQNVDDAVTAILDALSYCTKKYTISADTGVTEITCKNGTYENNRATYGSQITFRADSEDTAWYLEVTSRTSHKSSAFYGYGQSISVKVTGALNVTTNTKADSQKRVRIIRNYYNGEEKLEGQPIQFAEFVDSGSYTLPNAADTPAFAFYSFDGYYVGGVRYDAGDTVSISENTDIIAKYNYNASSSFVINATALTGGTSFSDSYEYNAKIELKGGDNAYGWSVDLGGGNYRPFYIGSDVTYYVMDSLNLVAEDKATFEAHGYSLPNIYLRNDGVIDVDEKITFNAQVVAESGGIIKESGILIAIPNGKQPGTDATVEPVHPDDYQIIVENSGQQVGYRIFRAKSTKLVGADQFAIAVKNLPEDYSYRAYVIYDNGGALETVYTDVVR